MNSFFKKLRIGILIILALILVGTGVVLSLNLYVKNTAGKNFLSPEQAYTLKDVDCIIVLGCKVHSNGSPSGMLNDRLTRGVDLYQNNAAPKLLMSGDHGQTEYDEVNTMKQFAMDSGIPSEDIFMDHAGFSTYETIYRAKEIFGADKVIIVTQEYHLYRAVYIAQALGMEAYGVNADYHTYAGQLSRDFREILARCKDFATTVFKPEPTYLGEKIDISGDGNVTNDK